ncbi:NADP-dependent oxidoreductase [Aeromicrobium ginsengisoli]|uniref:NADP-dependent oxidoreductase n=1 Tax=Aeromicrobium ginsengisoli TaxID=363867 RepID=A0A5M4FEK9_9ACTN|nr:NADP-dependent oxidoreductase [Aeromicrobium ginsengisoli]KAA1397658.1 NADP-dependent oxidoreductase [Aeromicrobium ginsengisoli]
MSLSGRQVQVVAYPRGPVEERHFEVVEVPVEPVGPGQVLVRNTWTSVDPGLRLRLREAAPEGYFVAFPLHAAMDGIMTIGEVVESRAEGFAPGDTVWHARGWRDYAVVDASAVQLSGLGTLRVLDTSIAEPQWYLGVLGGMGLTAYAGLSVVGALKGGETVWVSAAAGAVGSLAVQIAKLHGNRVVASAGSDDKVRWLLDDLGVDAAFSYRAAPVGEGLAIAAPEGIDVYFDCVGSDHLEAALDAMNRDGRIAICGSVSEYESEPAGPRNLFLAVAKDLTIRGFRGSSNLDLLDQMQAELGAALADGRLQQRETVFDGLASAPKALIEMIAGRTTGKTLVHLTDVR